MVANEEKNRWLQPWRHMLVIANAVLAHTVGVVAIIALIKGLEIFVHYLYGDEGLRFLKGTRFEVSVTVVFDIFDLWVFALYTIYAIADGIKRWRS